MLLVTIDDIKDQLFVLLVQMSVGLVTAYSYLCMYLYSNNSRYCIIMCILRISLHGGLQMVYLAWASRYS